MEEILQKSTFEVVKVTLLSAEIIAMFRLNCLVVLSLISLQVIARVSEDIHVVEFPLQFVANVAITSHLLDPQAEYPPSTRFMTVYYDYINRKARIDIESGYEAAKYYIRRYDNKTEYMVRLPPIDDCKRSFLLDEMPYPDIPDTIYVGNIQIDDIMCNYYLHEDYETRIHMYMSLESNMPVKLIEESIEDGISTEILTYDYSDVVLGKPDDIWFDLDESYDYNSCIRHTGGFPFLHVFHHFVKF